MRKLILISISLLIAGGLWAEQKVCRIELSDDFLKADDILEEGKIEIDTSIRKCFAKDLITWRSEYHLLNIYITTRYCHQEKEIFVYTNNDFKLPEAFCTYTGKKLKTRTEEESWICDKNWEKVCGGKKETCMSVLSYNKFGKKQYCYQ